MYTPSMGRALIISVQIVLVLLITLAVVKCSCGCWKYGPLKCSCCSKSADCCAFSTEHMSPGNAAISSQIPPNSHRMVTLYYTDWCQYCKIMKPVWNQVRAATSGSGIQFREIDNDKAKVANITGVPTIRMIDETGHTYDYKGGANYAELRNWMISPLIMGNR